MSIALQDKPASPEAVQPSMIHKVRRKSHRNEREAVSPSTHLQKRRTASNNNDTRPSGRIEQPQRQKHRLANARQRHDSTRTQRHQPTNNGTYRSDANSSSTETKTYVSQEHTQYSNDSTTAERSQTGATNRRPRTTTSGNNTGHQVTYRRDDDK